MKRFDLKKEKKKNNRKRQTDLVCVRVCKNIKGTSLMITHIFNNCYKTLV